MKTARRPGWVYILTNPAYDAAGLVKIGHTGRHPEIRAAELSAATGVAGRFVVAYAHPVRDHEALEGITHGRLAACRANDNREFFRCTVNEARRIIEQEGRMLLLPWWRVVLHRLVHPLPPERARAWSSTKRRSRGDSFTPIAMTIGLAIGGIIIFRPYWIPPAVLQFVQHLPGLH